MSSDSPTRPDTVKFFKFKPKDKSTEISLAYEVLGNGPIHVFMVQGLGTPGAAWHATVVAPFLSDPLLSSKYTFVTFDNRGVGWSDSPSGRYTTSMFAADALALLHHLQWTEPHSVHLVGISMGGMISQELAILCPERFQSVTLFVTTCSGGLMSYPPAGVGLIFKSMFVRTVEGQCKLGLKMCYSDEWVEAESKSEPGKKNFDVVLKEHMEMRARFPMTDNPLGPLFACQTHEVSKSRLKKLGASEFPILVIGAGKDRLIRSSRSKKLFDGLGGAECGHQFVMFEDSGHVVTVEKKNEIHALLKDHLQKAETKFNMTPIGL